MLLGLLPFVVFEIGLRISGAGRPQQMTDPFVGFSDVHPLFELDRAKSVYRTAPARERYFGMQSFDAVKPKNGFRAFVLGGSTVRGRPYETPSAFAAWMQLELDVIEPDRTHEIVNCGGLSYASYRLIPILQEVLGHTPDAIVVATGHNEFLEDRTYHDLKQTSAAVAWVRDRLFSLHSVALTHRLIHGAVTTDPQSPADGRSVLAAEVDARLDRNSGYASYHYDDQWQRDVVRHFEESLKTMVRMCQQANVRLIFVRLGSNLRACPPFKFEHLPKLSADDEAVWQAEFEAASAIDVSDPAAALERYHAAEAIEREHALLSWRMARCFDRLNQPEQAESYYVAARDQDICPLRATSAVTAALDRVAGETNTPTIDAQSLIRKQSADGIPGDDFYMDHVHPNIESHQQIGRDVVARWIDMSIVSPKTRWDRADRRAAYHRHFEAMGGLRYLKDSSRRVKWLQGWARRDRQQDEIDAATPLALLDQSYRELSFGDQDSGLAGYTLVLTHDPNLASHILLHSLRLFRQGRVADAQLVNDLAGSMVTDSDFHAALNVIRYAMAIRPGDVIVPELFSRNADSGTRNRFADAIDQWRSEILDP